MAIAQGENVLASDYTATRTAVRNYYKTVKGSYPTITEVAAGNIVTASAMNTLISAFETAEAGYHVYANDGYNANNLGSGARYRVVGAI